MSSDELKKLMIRYGCGPVQLTGSDEALFERRLVFDHVISAEVAGPREKFEAIAGALRDVLAQRWLKTLQTHDQANPKQVYYLSMEFLIGRSLSNNILNLQLTPIAGAFEKAKGVSIAELAEQEPDAGLGNGGLGRLAACFIESLATLQIPATDLSEQISTAGYEASETSNMKFMMNGALTVGTGDGANIEIAEKAGEENAFMFGLTAAQVLNTRGFCNPNWHYDHEPETKAALDMIFNNHFSPDEPGIFEPIRETLLGKGDYYLHLADLSAYVETQRRIVSYYLDRKGWAKKAVHNIARSGKFSSDRTISEYAREIWNVMPCPVK